MVNVITQHYSMINKKISFIATFRHDGLFSPLFSLNRSTGPIWHHCTIVFLHNVYDLGERSNQSSAAHPKTSSVSHFRKFYFPFSFRVIFLQRICKTWWTLPLGSRTVHTWHPVGEQHTAGIVGYTGYKIEASEINTMSFQGAATFQIKPFFSKLSKWFEN